MQNNGYDRHSTAHILLTHIHKWNNVVSWKPVYCSIQIHDEKFSHQDGAVGVAIASMILIDRRRCMQTISRNRNGNWFKLKFNDKKANLQYCCMVHGVFVSLSCQAIQNVENCMPITRFFSSLYFRTNIGSSALNQCTIWIALYYYYYDTRQGKWLQFHITCSTIQ